MAADRLQLMENQVEKQRHQERLALVGQLTAGVVHDARNLLCNLNLSVDRLEMMMPETDDETRTGMDRLHTLVKDLDNLFESVLSMSRNRSCSKMVEMARFVEGCLNLVRPTARGFGVKTLTSVPEGLWAQMVPGEMCQVVCNLILNACEALEDQEYQGYVAIEVSQQAGSVTLSVIDNGPGVPEDSRELIFEAFHTTKSQGTGLGLWNSQRIVNEHGGRLEFEPAPSGGARFTITLPVPEVQGAVA